MGCTVKAATTVSLHILPWQRPLCWTKQTPSVKWGAVHSPSQRKPGTHWVIRKHQTTQPWLRVWGCVHRKMYSETSFRILLLKSIRCPKASFTKDFACLTLTYIVPYSRTGVSILNGPWQNMMPSSVTIGEESWTGMRLMCSDRAMLSR